MKLFIDTSSFQKITIGLDSKVFETGSKREKAQALLPFLQECLLKESADIRDISEIEVHTGPGSFTGIRVGVSVANALGWALPAPVNGKDISSGQFLQINYASNE